MVQIAGSYAAWTHELNPLYGELGISAPDWRFSRSLDPWNFPVMILTTTGIDSEPNPGPGMVKTHPKPFGPTKRRGMAQNGEKR